MPHVIPPRGIWINGPTSGPHTLDKLYVTLRPTAERLDYVLETAIDPKRLCISFAPGAYTDATFGCLEICESGDGIAIYLHRTADLTQTDMGRVVSVQWVEAFMEAQSQKATRAVARKAGMAQYSESEWQAYLLLHGGKGRDISSMNQTVEPVASARATKFSSADLVACIQSENNSRSDLSLIFSGACRKGYLDVLIRLSDELDNGPWQKYPKIELPIRGDFVRQPDGYTIWVDMPKDEYQSRMAACAAQKEECKQYRKQDMADFSRTALNYISFTQQEALMLGKKQQLFGSSVDIEKYILQELGDVQIRENNVAKYLSHVDFYDVLEKSWKANNWEPSGETADSWVERAFGSSAANASKPNTYYGKDDGVDDDDPNE
jgi:hypothetical protein